MAAPYQTLLMTRRGVPAETAKHDEVLCSLVYPFRMAQAFLQGSQQYLSSIDAELTRLEQLRKHVAAGIKSSSAKTSVPNKLRTGMSEDGRRRVAEAQRNRWAKLKKEAKAAAKAVKKTVRSVEAKAAEKFAPKKNAAWTSGSSSATSSRTPS